MMINLMENVKKMMGWCPNASITEQKIGYVEYKIESINAGLPVKKWKLDLLIIGHVFTLLFASLFILPMSVYQAFDLHNISYLALNYGSFLADITLSVASMLFSVTTIVLIYNILIFRKLYSKLCYFNVILLSGLFAVIILELSLLNDNYKMEWSIYWAFIFALLPSIPSFLSIRFNKKYGQKLVTEGSGLVELIKHSIGWCPNASVASRKTVKLESIDNENIIGIRPPTAEVTVLWLSRIFGILDLPIAFIALIDGSLIFTLLNPSYIPETAQQWIGFFAAISAVAGAMAGLTAKSSHSMGRKIIHLLFAALGVIMTFNTLARLFFAGWLS
ncbi:MAG: hypothetical protein FIB07_10515 [Candidatus Methanoperedens sp.]|nr:hypothetical protein [Candidatus Methanoperedens sp.]